MRPTAFAAVMATGIVSIAATDNGFGSIGWPLAVLAAVGLPVLMWRAARCWRSFDLSNVDVAVGLFTFVAACTVLASRFSDYPVVVWCLGAMGLIGWLALVPRLLKAMWRLGLTGLRNRARGVWELASVATSGLAIVSVAVGNTVLALIFWCIALCVYGVMTLLVAWRARDEPAARRDVPPDHWILMGALAIATLAGARIYTALEPGELAEGVRIVALLTMSVAAAQIPPLAIRSWRQILDWPAVFPLGMFSEATYAMSRVTGWTALGAVSFVFFWIALVAWVLVVAVIVRGRLRSRSARAAGTQSDPAR